MHILKCELIFSQNVRLAQNIHTGPRTATTCKAVEKSARYYTPCTCHTHTHTHHISILQITKLKSPKMNATLLLFYITFAHGMQSFHKIKYACKQINLFIEHLIPMTFCVSVECACAFCQFCCYYWCNSHYLYYLHRSQAIVAFQPQKPNCWPLFLPFIRTVYIVNAGFSLIPNFVRLHTVN